MSEVPLYIVNFVKLPCLEQVGAVANIIMDRFDNEADIVPPPPEPATLNKP